MRLRIRHATGNATLSNIETESTLAQLKDAVANTLALGSQQKVEISGGYPPKPLNNDKDTLSASGLRDGDTLNVKVIECASVAPIQPQENSVPQSIVKEGAVETPTGFLTIRVMEDDNSCLFRSIARDVNISTELRQVVADAILSNPDDYSDVTLGQPRDKYVKWIQTPNAWGGGIELAILSSHFKIEIDSIDVKTGRIDKFGEGAYNERVLIVYSGIHYDALALAPSRDSPNDFDQTRFSLDEESILDSATRLTTWLKQNHKYTDLANFTLKCEQCKTGLVGEKDAQNHAEATGHTRFAEYQ